LNNITEANYLRHRILRTENDMLHCTERFLKLQQLRAALARTELNALRAELRAMVEEEERTIEGEIVLGIVP